MVVVVALSPTAMPSSTLVQPQVTMGSLPREATSRSSRHWWLAASLGPRIISTVFGTVSSAWNITALVVSMSKRTSCMAQASMLLLAHRVTFATTSLVLSPTYLGSVRTRAGITLDRSMIVPFSLSMWSSAILSATCSYSTLSHFLPITDCSPLGLRPSTPTFTSTSRSSGMSAMAAEDSSPSPEWYACAV